MALQRLCQAAPDRVHLLAVSSHKWLFQQQKWTHRYTEPDEDSCDNHTSHSRWWVLAAFPSHAGFELEKQLLRNTQTYSIFCPQFLSSIPRETEALRALSNPIFFHYSKCFAWYSHTSYPNFYPLVSSVPCFLHYTDSGWSELTHVPWELSRMPSSCRW